jgi:hypothetical protein
MLLKTKPARLFRWIYPAAIILLILVNLGNTTDKVRDHFPKLQKNIAGNKYYGFTPDWVNYFLMSEWAAKNIDKDKTIACRKASMSFIYTGRAFSGINSVPTVLSDSALLSSNFEQHFLGMKYSDIPKDILNILYPYTMVILVGDGSFYYTYDLPEPMYAEIAQSGIPIYSTPEELLSVMKTMKESYGVYPDKLLESLKSRNVGYVIDAKLRSNPAQNTGNTINTIERYMNFVHQKYPGTFRKIHQIGLDNNEPAMIYEIHYPK